MRFRLAWRAGYEAERNPGRQAGFRYEATVCKLFCRWWPTRIVANHRSKAMILPPAKTLLCLALFLVAGSLPAGRVIAKSDAADTAREVDRLLAEEVFKADTKLAPRTDDATYLRRVWLDIAGDIPSPEDVTAFVLDPAKDKRERIEIGRASCRERM